LRPAEALPCGIPRTQRDNTAPSGVVKQAPCFASNTPGNNVGMHLDHLSFAAGPDGLEATAQRLGAQLGVTFLDGGFHPRFGTRNRILPLTAGHYLEVVGVLDHPAADKAPFGQAVRARSAEGGGWLGWVVAVDDLAPFEVRMGRPAIEGHRYLPDGTVLTWHQLGVKDLQVDPQLPFFVKWSRDAIHPSAGGREVELLKIEIAGDPARVEHWLGGRSKDVLADVDIGWCQPGDRTGLAAAIFSTPRGEVRI
jgi:Glyoxalase-like domain